MAESQRVMNSSPSGRILTGSANATKAPTRAARARRAPDQQTRQAARSRTAAAPTSRTARRFVNLRKPIGKSTLKKHFRKPLAIGKALTITLTLVLPSALQLVLGIAMATAVGLFNDGFIAWATENVGVVTYVGEALFGALWITSVALNLLMFLYSIAVFTFTGTHVFTPSALVILALCLACILVPVINIVPWVLIYVWVVALTR